MNFFALVKTKCLNTLEYKNVRQFLVGIEFVCLIHCSEVSQFPELSLHTKRYNLCYSEWKGSYTITDTERRLNLFRWIGWCS